MSDRKQVDPRILEMAMQGAAMHETEKVETSKKKRVNFDLEACEYESVQKASKAKGLNVANYMRFLLRQDGAF